MGSQKPASDALSCAKAAYWCGLKDPALPRTVAEPAIRLDLAFQFVGLLVPELGPFFAGKSNVYS